MVIALKYRIKNGRVVSYEHHKCPYCGYDLICIGSRKRGIKLSGGKNIRIRIRRLRCEHCHRIHHELPDMIVPYKRYEKSVFHHIIDLGKMEDGIEISTYYHIRKWWNGLKNYADSIVSIEKTFYETVKKLISAGKYPHTRYEFLYFA